MSKTMQEIIPVKTGENSGVIKKDDMRKYLMNVDANLQGWDPDGTGDLAVMLGNAVAELGEAAFHLPSGRYTVQSSVTLAASSALLALPGAEVEVQAGAVLTVSGGFTAWKSIEVFSGLGRIEASGGKWDPAWFGCDRVGFATISGGTVADLSGLIYLKPESGAADDLDDITGTYADGDRIMLSASKDGDTITVKHLAGTIELSGSVDMTLAGPDDKLVLRWDNADSKWVEFARMVGVDLTLGELMFLVEDDPDIVRRNVPSYLETIYAHKYQVHTGNSLSGFVPTSNCVLWELTEDSTLDELTFSEETYLTFQIIPNGFNLSYASAYVQYCDDFSSSAPGVRVGVDILGSVKNTYTIVGR